MKQFLPPKKKNLNQQVYEYSACWFPILGHDHCAVYDFSVCAQTFAKLQSII